jgi:hypothetical protein
VNPDSQQEFFTRTRGVVTENEVLDERAATDLDNIATTAQQRLRLWAVLSIVLGRGWLLRESSGTRHGGGGGDERSTMITAAFPMRQLTVGGAQRRIWL